MNGLLSMKVSIPGENSSLPKSYLNKILQKNLDPVSDNQQQQQQKQNKFKAKSGSGFNESAATAAAAGASPLFHDNPVFEHDLVEASGKRNKLVLNSIHHNHEQIHLNKLDTLNNTLAQTTTAKSSRHETSCENNGGGAYAIASSTTLLYITQPKHTLIPPTSANSTADLAKYQSGEPAAAFASPLTSYNTTERLAAAAAAAVTSAAATVIDIPNFSQELSTMMQNSNNNRPVRTN